jgi:uncharacterized LabA/DUF88 family protein
LGEASHLSGCAKLKGFIFGRYIVESRHTKRTAILVDGGYYRIRSQDLWGRKPPKERAEELYTYCMNHITKPDEPRDLYRIFYYDCPPMKQTMVHPLSKKEIDFSKGAGTKWALDFHRELSDKRKVALRMGELAENAAEYTLKPNVLSDLLSGKKTVAGLDESDFRIDVKQKGVDMRIGLDVASLAQGRYVDQIVLIAGDSDFLPVAKMARRNGLDFLLDPMKQRIKQGLRLHVDGIESFVDADDAE